MPKTRNFKCMNPDCGTLHVFELGEDGKISISMFNPRKEDKSGKKPKKKVSSEVFDPTGGFASALFGIGIEGEEEGDTEED